MTIATAADLDRTIRLEARHTSDQARWMGSPAWLTSGRPTRLPIPRDGPCQPIDTDSPPGDGGYPEIRGGEKGRLPLDSRLGGLWKNAEDQKGMLERVASDLVSRSWLSIGPLVNGFGGHC